MQRLTDLRISIVDPTIFSSEWSGRNLGLAGDSIIFEIDHRAHRFGRLLAVSQAQRLIDMIKKYQIHPSL